MGQLEVNVGALLVIFACAVPFWYFWTRHDVDGRRRYKMAVVGALAVLWVVSMVAGFERDVAEKTTGALCIGGIIVLLALSAP